MPANTPRTTVDFLVLAVLADGPRHGYALAQALEERSGGRMQVRPGDLYRVLYRLRRAGLLEPVPSRAKDDDRRQMYRLTPQGRRTAHAEARYLHAVCAGLLRTSGAGRPS